MRARTASRFAMVVLAAALIGAGLGAPGAALAAPGDNGDVKIHSSGTPVDDPRDEPQVCEFYLDAFDFDGLQEVSWHIDQQEPTGTAQVASGTITLDADGNGHTADMTLPSGHYKLTWNWEGEQGAGKSKVFTVECASPSPSTSPSTGSASPSASTSPSGSASPSTSASPSASASPTSAAPVSPHPSGSGSAGPTLPVTGMPLGVLAAIAGALVAGGVALRIRMRRRS
ncbi:hypothetical protein [Actinocatenispora comari]|uniref:hypothetical protein n=1 Tax=Actinocatenispora comari TaxID=2807577 RepID=UPI001A92FE07|nr:hypothetical protein [Actinocatenispora comari]